MNDAVIFSSWVPTSLFHRGEQYLKILLQYFSDCDIFCGINYGTDPRWLDLLEHYKRLGLNLEYKMSAPSLSVNSDNTGYQAALSLYKFTNKKHNLTFFTHTKSISHPESAHKEGFDHMVVSFHKNRNRVSTIMSSHDKIGGWAPVGRINYEYLGLNKINEYYPFPCEALPITYVLTNYVIRGNIIKQFIDSCHPVFFTTPYEILGYNRYFFEFYFPNIISKMGYIPLVDELWERPTQKEARAEMKINFGNWKNKNELTRYLEDVELFDGMKP